MECIEEKYIESPRSKKKKLEKRKVEDPLQRIKRMKKSAEEWRVKGGWNRTDSHDRSVNERDRRIQRTKESNEKVEEREGTKAKGNQREITRGMDLRMESGWGRNEIKGGMRRRNHRKGNVCDKVEKGASVYRRINPYKASLRQRYCYAKSKQQRPWVLPGFRSNYLTRRSLSTCIYPLDDDVSSHPGAVIAAFSTRPRRLT